MKYKYVKGLLYASAASVVLTSGSQVVYAEEPIVSDEGSNYTEPVLMPTPQAETEYLDASASSNTNEGNSGAAQTSAGAVSAATVAAPTATIGPSAAAVPSAAALPSISAGPSASVSPSISVGPSASVSPSISAGPSATVSPSISAGPSVSVSPSISAGPSATASPSATLGPTATAVPSITPTPTQIPERITNLIQRIARLQGKVIVRSDLNEILAVKKAYDRLPAEEQALITNYRGLRGVIRRIINVMGRDISQANLELLVSGTGIPAVRPIVTPSVTPSVSPSVTPDPSGTPDDPENPDVTGVPEDPENPEVTPAPENPDITPVPENPDVTGIPDDPDATPLPENPEVTGVPEDPNATPTPAVPSGTPTPTPVEGLPEEELKTEGGEDLITSGADEPDGDLLTSTPVLTTNMVSNLHAGNQFYLNSLKEKYQLEFSSDFASMVEQIEQEYKEENGIVDVMDIEDTDITSDMDQFLVRNWQDVLAVYVYRHHAEGETSYTIDSSAKEELAEIFREMNPIKVDPTGAEGMSYGNLHIGDYIEKHDLSGNDAELLNKYLETDCKLLCAIVTDSRSFVRQSVGDGVSEDRVNVITAAYSLIGEIGYFWGGKSFCVGPDREWGTAQMVVSTGSSTTGTIRAYGLDCSGFVTWAVINGYKDPYMEYEIGDGTSSQWENANSVAESNAQPGDLVFQRGPEWGSDNHVGIICGQTDAGDWLAVHCSASVNGVSVGEAYSASFRYIRQPSFYPSRDDIGRLKLEGEELISDYNSGLILTYSQVSEDGSTVETVSVPIVFVSDGTVILSSDQDYEEAASDSAVADEENEYGEPVVLTDDSIVIMF